MRSMQNQPKIAISTLFTYVDNVISRGDLKVTYVVNVTFYKIQP